MAIYQGQAKYIFSIAKIKIAGLKYNIQLKDDLISQGFQRVKELKKYKKELNLGFITKVNISSNLQIIIIRLNKNSSF